MSSRFEPNPHSESVRLACTELSMKRGEALVGTAPRVDIWFLLAYPGPWGEKALAERALPQPLTDWAAARINTLPHARLLLIKQGSEHPDDRLPLFINISDQQGSKLYKVDLNSYEDLYSLDLTGMIGGRPIRRVQQHPTPLYLVCTNGKRDACCAREGLPVYRALQEQVGNQVWQCTHVGGHRFAANVLVFPEGLYYGRLSPGDTSRLSAATAQKEILLRHFRGRACYEPVVQAAESHLRALQDAAQFDRFRFQDAREVGEDNWQVFFKDIHEMAVCQLDIRINSSPDQAFQSCKGYKQTPSFIYELVDTKIHRDQPGSNPG